MEILEKQTFTSPVFRCSVFKWWSEFSPVFKWHLNNGPFGYRTTFNHRLFKNQTGPVFRYPQYFKN